MNKYTTIIEAIDITDGKLKMWQGPHIEAISFDDAKQICNSTGRGYLQIDGKLEKEIGLNGKILLDFRTMALN